MKEKEKKQSCFPQVDLERPGPGKQSSWRVPPSPSGGRTPCCGWETAPWFTHSLCQLSAPRPPAVCPAPQLRPHTTPTLTPRGKSLGIWALQVSQDPAALWQGHGDGTQADRPGPRPWGVLSPSVSSWEGRRWQGPGLTRHRIAGIRVILDPFGASLASFSIWVELLLPGVGRGLEGESWEEWEVREGPRQDGKKEVILQSGFRFKPVPSCVAVIVSFVTFLLYSVFLGTPSLGRVGAGWSISRSES